MPVLCKGGLILESFLFWPTSPKMGTKSRPRAFLTAILHRGLRNDFLIFQFLQFTFSNFYLYFCLPFSFWTLISLFSLDFYFPFFLWTFIFPFLFGLLFSFWSSISFLDFFVHFQTFISLLSLDFYFPFSLCKSISLLDLTFISFLDFFLFWTFISLFAQSRSHFGFLPIFFLYVDIAQGA